MREDELATILLDFVDTVKDLKEEMHQGNRMSRGANAVVQERHVLDVAVVSLVKVFAVPA